MREILFKAKRADNGEWVKGYYAFIDGTHYIYTGALRNGGLYVVAERFEVDPETICQYTGLTDKNGKKIFENDLLGCKYNKVEFMCGTYCINGDTPLSYMNRGNEVIGNVYDNIELLGDDSDDTN